MFGWLDPILNPLACLPLPPDAVGTSQEKAETVLRRLEALLQQKLRYALIGEKRSIVRGQGLDFADLHEYTPGDDIRKIDWSVFARTLSPHVREYHEEKQLTLWLAVDCTPSMHFGRAQTKMGQAVELAGLICLLADKANHKLGAFLIKPEGTEIIPPRTGHAQVQRVMQTLLDTSTEAPESKIAEKDPLPNACTQLGHLVQKHTTVIFLSDFLSFSDRWGIPLGQLSRHARMIYLLLQDPVELRLPEKIGLLPVIDPETGESVTLDTHDAAFLKAYETHAVAAAEGRLHRLRETGIAVTASTERDPADIILELVKDGLHPTPRRRA